ncbi:unnamed protein product, partial [Discosporangium mesarthrocarpum]
MLWGTDDVLTPVSGMIQRKELPIPNPESRSWNSSGSQLQQQAITSIWDGEEAVPASRGGGYSNNSKAWFTNNQETITTPGQGQRQRQRQRCPSSTRASSTGVIRSGKGIHQHQQWPRPRSTGLINAQPDHLAPIPSGGAKALLVGPELSNRCSGAVGTAAVPRPGQAPGGEGWRLQSEWEEQACRQEHGQGLGHGPGLGQSQVEGGMAVSGSVLSMSHVKTIQHVRGVRQSFEHRAGSSDARSGCGGRGSGSGASTSTSTSTSTRANTSSPNGSIREGEVVTDERTGSVNGACGDRAVNREAGGALGVDTSPHVLANLITPFKFWTNRKMPSSSQSIYHHHHQQQQQQQNQYLFPFELECMSTATSPVPRQEETGGQGGEGEGEEPFFSSTSNDGRGLAAGPVAEASGTPMVDIEVDEQSFSQLQRSYDFSDGGTLQVGDFLLSPGGMKPMERKGANKPSIGDDTETQNNKRNKSSATGTRASSNNGLSNANSITPPPQANKNLHSTTKRRENCRPPLLNTKDLGPGLDRCCPRASGSHLSVRGSSFEGRHFSYGAAGVTVSTPRRLCDSMILLEEIGHGAGGRVLKALHITSMRLVAVKMVEVHDDSKRKQMLDELRALHTRKVPLAMALSGSSFSRGQEGVDTSWTPDDESNASDTPTSTHQVWSGTSPQGHWPSRGCSTLPSRAPRTPTWGGDGAGALAGARAQAARRKDSSPSAAVSRLPPTATTPSGDLWGVRVRATPSGWRGCSPPSLNSANQEPATLHWSRPGLSGGGFRSCGVGEGSPGVRAGEARASPGRAKGGKGAGSSCAPNRQ